MRIDRERQGIAHSSMGLCDGSGTETGCYEASGRVLGGPIQHGAVQAAIFESQNRLPKKPKGDVPDATSILFAVYGDCTRQTRTKKPKCETSRAHEEGSFPGLRHGLEVPRLGLKHPRVSLELTVSETQNRVSEGLAGGLTEWLPGRVALSMQVDGRGGRRVTRRSMFHATPQGRHLSSLVASTGPSWHWDTVDWGWGGGGGGTWESVWVLCRFFIESGPIRVVVVAGA